MGHSSHHFEELLGFSCCTEAGNAFFFKVRKKSPAKVWLNAMGFSMVVLSLGKLESNVVH